MAEIGNPQPTPKVGIGGNTQSIKPLEQSESLHAEVGQPNYSEAFARLATTPTALGEVSSNMMLKSSVAIAQKLGQNLGKNPQGDILPPITKFDQAFADSYTAQAETTLGLQASEMMYKGQEELNKAYKLSPQMIETYKKNMIAGLQETLKLAPTSIQPQMAHQFGQQVLSTTHQFNDKMISQNKEQASQQFEVWRNSQNKQMMDALKDGNTKLADSINSSISKSIDARLASGMISPTSADTYRTSNRINYESANAIRAAMQARSSGTLPEYLSSIADRKIGNLGWSESESVRNNVVQYIGAVESADNRNQSLFMAQGANDIVNGQFTTDRQLIAKQNLTPTNYLNLMTSFASSQKKASGAAAKQDFLIKNANNVDAYSGMTAKDINDSYDSLTQSAMVHAQQSGEALTLDEAQFRVASYMAHPVPKFIDKINNELQSSNGQDKLRGLESYERLGSLSGQKTQGINEKSVASAELFRAFLDQGLDPQTAAEKSNDVVFNKDKDTYDLNKLKIGNYLNAHAVDYADRISHFTKMAGFSSSSHISNPSALSGEAMALFKGYMQLTNGDEKVSSKMTHDAMQRTWGQTNINGITETIRLPVDKVIGLGEGSSPLIQQDIVNQLEPQFDIMRKAYDNGTSPFYLRVKAGRTSFDEYAAIKAKMHEWPTVGEFARNILKDYASDIKNDKEAQRKLRDFEEAKPIEIEQVYRDGSVKPYNVYVSTPSYAEVSPINGQVTSGYNINVRDQQTGLVSFMHGNFGATRITPEYRPNTKWISDRYIAVNGLTPKMTFEELRERKSRRAEEERVMRAVNSFARF